MSNFVATQNYLEFLTHLKNKITAARFRAVMALNNEVIRHYWELGTAISQKMQGEEWGSGFIQRLSNDLQLAIPESRGYSISNLKRMRRFAELYPDFEIGAQAVRQLPWGHIVVLIQQIENQVARDWYAMKAFEEGWSREELIKSIQHNQYVQQGINSTKVSNFRTRLPSPQSELADDMLKNPYNFEMLCLQKDAEEREIENAMVKHIKPVLMEFGRGFAFYGQQYPIEFEGETYWVDLLMYNVKLHAFMVVELKAKKFKPEHAGQLNFYLNLVDDFVKSPGDNPTMGLLLCKSSNRFVAEYALKGIEKPIGVSEYQLTKAIPSNLQSSLPTVEELEVELNSLDISTDKNNEDPVLDEEKENSREK